MRFTVRPIRFGRKAAAESDEAERLPTPAKVKLLARRQAGIAEAKAVLEHLPEPGESLHAVVTARLDLTDIINALLARIGTCERMRVATLGYNVRNLKIMLSWLDSGTVQGDIRAALAVLSDEAKLLGLYAPVKVAPTTPQGDQPYALSDEDRAAALHRIYAAVGAGGGATHPDESSSADGSVLGEPGSNSDRCRDDTGPLAGEAAADQLDESAAPLFPSGG